MEHAASLVLGAVGSVPRPFFAGKKRPGYEAMGAVYGHLLSCVFV